ncbi:hypothetical protein ACFC14_18560 [Microbacterium sp. NPDC055988]|uniref:hypothetical protein n=1 Tax=Microbacterium sp. NPDC055988 TaxID=3345671 RepID=UPI0035DF5A47
MSSPAFYARKKGQVPMSLNDVEVFAQILNVTPLEVHMLANHLGKIDADTMPSDASSITGGGLVRAGGASHG